MNIPEFQAHKNSQKKLALVTCSDFWSAQLVQHSSIDAILVGDSLSMVMHGHPNTLHADLEMMQIHCLAVRRGAPEKLLIVDMPFLEAQISTENGLRAAQSLMRSGAQAIKIEGAGASLPCIRKCVESGVPVMGHLGLTPQSVHSIGGYKVQGKTPQACEKIKAEALLLQEAGCFSLVLECIPSSLARELRETLKIPIVGIGAGAACDGQILVFQDLLGLQNHKSPRFVRRFVRGFESFTAALEAYVTAVQTEDFPSPEESYDP
ncbi:MAG: 3-methyl-2-oxobutanoate hydroxymethyltransferase [Bdellovibrio sp.]